MSERDKIFEHEYDGIREYDNPLPAWWSWLFIGTMIWSVAYIGYYHLGPGKLSRAEYADEMAEWREQEKALALSAGEITEGGLQTLMADAAAVAEGRQKYALVCAACHGDRGEGKIGPNLTDDMAIHGDGSLLSILDVVKTGVLVKGMPAWERVMSPQELRKVTAFIGTLRASNAPGGKAPEGTKMTALGPQAQLQ